MFNLILFVCKTMKSFAGELCFLTSTDMSLDPFEAENQRKSVR